MTTTMFRLLLVGQFLLVTTQGVSAADCSGPPAFRPAAADLVEAAYRQTVRRGKQHVDYKRIDVTWQPFLMVEEGSISCLDKSQLSLEFKAGSAAAWAKLEESPQELGGGRYRWSLDVVPCHEHFLRLSVGGLGGTTALELPQPVPAAAAEDIIASGFSPEAPRDLTVVNLDEKSVRVSWTPSECAQSYDISYGLVAGGGGARQSRLVAAADGHEVILTEGLEPCRDYALTAAAVIGEDGYSEESGASFSTPPDAAAATKLEPAIVADVSGVKATWKTWDALSCVEKYEVSVCHQEDGACDAAGNVQTLTRDNSLPFMEFKEAGLEQCSPFTLAIRPLYAGRQLAPKLTSFRTLAPAAATVADQLQPVTAAKGGESGQKVFVAWSSVACADHYEVFQQISGPGSNDWEMVGRTSETSLTVNAAPCTAYRYGVKVTVAGVASQMVEVAEAVMTSLDRAAPFVLANLHVDPRPTSALLTWDHAACIASYVVSTCTTAAELVDKLCERSTVVADDHHALHISFEVAGLRPCAHYTLEVVPVIDGAELTASAATAFSTAFPPATPPSSYTAVLNAVRGRVELAWSQVDCASGYRIVQRMGNSDTTTAWETNDGKELFTSFQDPEPCVTYRSEETDSW